MGAHNQSDAAPAEFRRALEEFRSAPLRPEISCEEMPAPSRVAPYAAALTADVTVGGNDIATGRIVLLYDPAGNAAWEGTFRCVVYVRSELEPETVTDPMIGEVGWAWLTEALDSYQAEYAAPSGTVTRVVSESFGGMAEEPGRAEIEIRASWSPIGNIGAHVEAWGQLLCSTAGLPPVPAGVIVMPSRRGQR
jgi:Protein of unknown function (DUF3000)